MLELINKFITCTTGEKMCVVRTKGGVSVVSEEEYRWMYGQCYPEKWNGKKAA